MKIIICTLNEYSAEIELMKLSNFLDVLEVQIIFLQQFSLIG